MNDLASNTTMYKSSSCECDRMVYQVVIDCHRSWILLEYFIEYALSTMFCISDTDRDIELVNEADFESFILIYGCWQNSKFAIRVVRFAGYIFHW